MKRLGDVMKERKIIWNSDYTQDCVPNFTSNMNEPRHRWYDFKEGFSSTLVKKAIEDARKTKNDDSRFTLLDPFSGSGTSILTALQNDCDAIGFEINPFMSFVGQTKCIKKSKEYDKYIKELDFICKSPPFRKKSSLEGISTFSPPKNIADGDKWLFNLDVLRTFEALKNNAHLVEDSDIFILALLFSMMQCCNAKKDGKCLRYIKSWKENEYSGQNLRKLFRVNANNMIEDIVSTPLNTGNSKIILGDARELFKRIETNAIDLIIFSPPYLNTFDYSDIYRPELYLSGMINNNDELMQIRKKTIRSHVQCKWEHKDCSNMLSVKRIVGQLEKKKSDLWNTNIPQMISSYFFDLEIVINQAYRVAKPGAKLWFVVSTSAYAGIEIPVDIILADIAETNHWIIEGVYALRKLRTSSQCENNNKQKVKLRESLIICRKKVCNYENN